MSGFEMCHWSITVLFDSPVFSERAREFQQDADAGNGLTEAQAYVAWLRRRWGLDGEEFDELAAECLDIRVREGYDMITVTSDVWDDYGDIMSWLIGNTSPIRVSIVRND